MLADERCRLHPLVVRREAPSSQRMIIRGRGSRELARGDACPLHPLDGRRKAPDSRWMAMRGPDGAERSVRAIDIITSGHEAQRNAHLVNEIVMGLYLSS